MASKWVRQQARYRIVADVISGGSLDTQGYTDEELDEVTAEIRRVLARHERYAAELGVTDRG